MDVQTGRIAAEPAKAAASWRRAAGAVWYGVGPFVALVAAWWVAAWVWRPGPAVLPSPADVAAEALRAVQGGVLVDAALRSMARLLLTAAAAVPAGVAIALAVGTVPAASELLMPVLRYLTAIPAIAWLPVFLVALGFNETSVVATAAYSFFFPVLFNTLVGVQTVPLVLRHAVRTLGGSGIRVVRDVLLPGSLPSIAAGVRLGFGYGWRALVGAEMLAAQGGIGHLLFKAQSVGLVPRMVVGMVTIGVLAALVDALLLEPLEEATVRRWGTVRG
ncbi:Putative aliphatic sulfonates transport permease protein SsuC [bacterium HR32]|jgi:taurine transport system permease protein|nr:Putative aliphatic sulfonates transport permease protein SsuC [bacterium HR32]